MKENKTNTSKKEDVNKWEKNFHKNHPLFSQIAASSLGGIVAGIVVALWAAYYIPPRPHTELSRTSQSSYLFQVENRGYIPADIIYDIASPPAAVPNFTIDEGQEYIKLENTSDEHIKRAVIKGLPKSGKIEIIISGISGTKDVTIHKK
ncbi:MAG: hypothetical protein WC539_03060 [Nitrospirota bacterium]